MSDLLEVRMTNYQRSTDIYHLMAAIDHRVCTVGSQIFDRNGDLKHSLDKPKYYFVHIQRPKKAFDHNRSKDLNRF